jgi:4-hydroxybenzoate polyprenyltransferase
MQPEASAQPVTSSGSEIAAVTVRAPSAASALAAVVASLRPRQWVKNLFVFAGLVFAQQLFTPAALTALAAFAIFCALSGAVYLVNDVADRERDRRHPTKRLRPIAAGRLSAGAGLAIAILLVIGALAASLAITPAFALVAVAYAGLLTAYSAWLKHIVILDVLVVAMGFTLRAVAGAVAIRVEISSWLLICTILIALFLALGKRRHEYVALRAVAAGHRPILDEYSEALLDQMIAVVTASTVTAYALYTMSPETVAKFHTHWLPATMPFVLYGIFRYLYLIYRKELGGNPSEAFLSDRALQINTGAWIAAVLVIIYGPRF